MKSVEDRLRELPEDAGLKRIEADDMLRRRILKAASEQERKKPAPVRWIAAAAVLVLAAGIFTSVSLLNGRNNRNPMLTSQSAGTAASLESARESGLMDVHRGTDRKSHV